MALAVDVHSLTYGTLLFSSASTKLSTRIWRENILTNENTWIIDLDFSLKKMADNNMVLSPETGAGKSDESGAPEQAEEEDPCSENAECTEEILIPSLTAPPENE